MEKMKIERIKNAFKAASAHLLISMLVAMLCAAIVFWLWYPPPYDQISSGRQLFVLVMAVDIVCGPVLTFIVFDRLKSRGELLRDMGFVVLLQLTALAYGLFSVMQARPVWLAFEGDRFRVVSVPDIDIKRLSDAPASMQNLSLTGPKLLGVQLIDGDDPGYRRSIELALEGLHPAFRPGRWTSYEQQEIAVRKIAKPLNDLYKKYPQQEFSIKELVHSLGVSDEKIGYLPLQANNGQEWTVLIDLDTARPKKYIFLNAWD